MHLYFGVCGNRSRGLLPGRRDSTTPWMCACSEFSIVFFLNSWFHDFVNLLHEVYFVSECNVMQCYYRELERNKSKNDFNIVLRKRKLKRISYSLN